jgi:1-pyrroline-5-carboxylate dehydrogenase
MYTPPSSIAGNIRTTTPVNEPVHDYAPGSPEAVRLIEEIQRVGSAVREFPHVIDGERLALERPSMSWHA